MKPIGRILFVALAALLGQTAAGQSGVEYRIETVAGTGERGTGGDGGPAVEAQLWYPADLAVDAAGNIYIADLGHHRIRKVDAATGIISTVPTSARLYSPSGVAVDGVGNLYVAGDVRVRKVDASTGNVSTVAGTGIHGSGGDGGPAVEAQLYHPDGVAVDASGNVYFGDRHNNRVRRVDAATGIISTFAGGGSSLGDGGPATSAQLNFPRGLAFDGAGNLYIADASNYRIRKVDTAGVITTIAGTGAARGYTYGDGGPAVRAWLGFPADVAVDGAGNIYIADAGHNRIRKVDASTGIITTIAGNRNQEFSGDGGLATLAGLYNPYDVALDAAGNIYIVDYSNHSIRRLTPIPKESIPADTPRISSGGIGLATGAPVVDRISPNAIISVFGSEFAPEGTQAASPMLDAAGRVATELAGVCLEIDGKRAPLFAVFPHQINAQVPHDLTPRQAYDGAIGISEVTAIRNCGAENERRSFAAAVEVAAVWPAFYNFHIDAGGRNPIVAVRSDGTLAGPPGVVPGVEVVPAEPGEILTFYGTGFGLTNPLLEAGQIPAGAAPITGRIEFTLGGITLFPEDVLYAGAAPGLAGIYQFAVRVPRSFPDSLRAPVIAAVNGVPSPEGPFLAVRRRE